MKKSEHNVKHRTIRRPAKVSAKTAPSKSEERYFLRLYVAGSSARSRQAILRASEMCAGELKGRCKLEVIDIYQQPIRARNGQIVATPTLVKELPRPVRRLIGNLANSSRLFVALGLETPE
jgi:circadian clock protein KaiB